MNTLIEQLKNQGHVWAGHQNSQTTLPHCPTGYEQLDQALPGQGWPSQGITEILVSAPGQGELRLLMPALRQLRQEHSIIWINPPFMPYAPALLHWGLMPQQQLICQCRNIDEVVWTAEQCLHSGECAALLIWQHELSTPQLRRIQLSAETSLIPVFLFRRPAAEQQPAFSRLRIGVRGDSQQQTHIRILRCRGHRSRQELTLHIPLSDPGFPL